MQNNENAMRSFKWWQAIIFFLLLIAFSLVTSSTLQPVVSILHLPDNLQEIVSLLLTDALLYGLTIVLMLVWCRQPFGFALPHKLPGGGRLALILLAVLCLTLGGSIVISEIDNVLRLFFHLPDLAEGFFSQLEQPHNIGWALLILCVVAPLSEEYIFRGLVMRNLARNHKTWLAIGLSALLFGLFHMNPAQIPFACIMGILLGWSVWVTDSLLPGLLIHAASNAISLFAGYDTVIAIPGFNVTGSFQPLWLDIAGVLLLAAGVALMLWGSRGTERLRGKVSPQAHHQATALPSAAYAMQADVPLAGQSLFAQADMQALSRAQAATPTDTEADIPQMAASTIAGIRAADTLPKKHRWIAFLTLALAIINIGLAAVAIYALAIQALDAEWAQFAVNFGMPLSWWTAGTCVFSLLRKDCKRVLPILALVLTALAFILLFLVPVVYGFSLATQQLPLLR